METSPAEPESVDLRGLAVIDAEASPGDADSASSDDDVSARHWQGAGTSVYVLSNDTDENQVLRYQRHFDGTLTLAGTYPTGGMGNGAGLGSQGAVVLSSDGGTLAAVNAGSDSISIFAVDRRGELELQDVEPSGGELPVSLTMDRDRLYVLNAGDKSIQGFRMRHHDLRPLARSRQMLSGEGGAQIEFTPRGDRLVVTLKASDAIDVFALDRHDRALPATTSASIGRTPFGFAFARNGTLLVANAAGGEAQASTMSSYRIDRWGQANDVQADFPTHQSAACWVAATANGRYAYTTNTGSSSITGFRMHRDGTFDMLNEDGVTGVTGEGSRPADVAIAGNYLFTRNGGTATITVHQIQRDGHLVARSTFAGLPPHAVGIAAR
jgi:6-phosphogluconolactonase (cycloisomerase 2 family)